jgi:RNA polymerase sigma factor (sigma-70 family)
MCEHDLFVTHSDEVIRAAKSVCRRCHVLPADSDDFLQDVYAYLLSNEQKVFGGFAGRSTLETYLFRVISRFAYRRMAVRRYRRTEVLDDDLASTVHTSATQEGDLLRLENSGLLRQVNCALAEALSSMPLQARQLIRLRILEGLDAKRTAIALGLTPKAVYRRTDRALLRLRNKLERRGITEDDIHLIRTAMAIDHRDDSSLSLSRL